MRNGPIFLVAGSPALLPPSLVPSSLVSAAAGGGIRGTRPPRRHVVRYLLRFAVKNERIAVSELELFDFTAVGVQLNSCARSPSSRSSMFSVM